MEELLIKRKVIKIADQELEIREFFAEGHLQFLQKQKEITDRLREFSNSINHDITSDEQAAFLKMQEKIKLVDELLTELAEFIVNRYRTVKLEQTFFSQNLTASMKKRIIEIFGELNELDDLTKKLTALLR